MYFNNLWHKFEEIDSDHDRRLTPDEFAHGCSVVGMDLSAEEAAAEFAKIDTDGGGVILFVEFCTWCVKRHVGEDDDDDEVGEAPDEAAAQAAAATKIQAHHRGKKARKAAHKQGGGAEQSKPKPEPVTQLVMPDKKGRAALFREIDNNGNGGLSLAEIDKAVVDGQIGRALGCADFNHKPALMRAYKAADTSGDGFIERREFFKLLKYV